MLKNKEIEVGEEDLSGPAWASAGYSGSGFVFRFRAAQQFSSFEVNLEEDFLVNLQNLLVTMKRLKLKGLYIEQIQCIPVSSLAFLFEFMLASDLMLVSHSLSPAPSGTPELIDLRSRNFKLVQRRYSGGVLDGRLISKYGWYDRRFFEIVEAPNGGVDVYAKRVVNGQADILFLGPAHFERVPIGYDFVGSRNFDSARYGVDSLTDHLEVLHRMDRFELSNIEFCGDKIWFLTHPRLTNPGELKEWIVNGAAITVEGTRELAIGKPWWGE